MGTTKIEGHYLAVSDYDSDYLESLGDYPKGHRLVHVTGLVRDAGGHVLNGTDHWHLGATDTEESLADDREVLARIRPDMRDDLFDPERIQREIEQAQIHAQERERWSQENHRRSPPVMRVKITVEVEMLSDDEAGAVWDQHQRDIEAHRAQCDAEHTVKSQAATDPQTKDPNETP